MRRLAGKPIGIFVVWEPVLITDWGRPSTATLGRISDQRASQYWDRRRLISRSMGEHGRHSVVWDFVAVYGPGQIWVDRPPQPIYDGGPVVRVADSVKAALDRLLRVGS